MWSAAVLALAFAQGHEGHGDHGEAGHGEAGHGEAGHGEVLHVKDFTENVTESILAAPDPAPSYCAFAAWEVPDCLGIAQKDTIENYQHMRIRRNVITVIIWVVAALSVFFEWASDRARRYASRQGPCAVEIVRSLTQEIMSVGFIMLMCTVLIQTGEMMVISDIVFGQHGGSTHTTIEHLKGRPHDVRLGHQVSELTVLFQDVHFFITCVVLSLVSMGALSLVFEKMLARRWREAEHLIDEFGSVMGAYDHLLTRDEAGGWWRHYVTRQQLTYLAFRSEFLDPHQGTPPPHVHPERFSFFLYLHRAMGDAILRALHCPKWVYLIYLVVLCCTLPFVGFVDRTVINILVLLAWVQLFIYSVILGKLHWIEDQLRPSADALRAKHAGEEVSTVALAKFRKRAQASSGASLHESLFWFGSRGPRFMELMLQALLSGLALYVAILLYHVLTHPLAWSKYAWWALPLTAGPVVAILSGLYPECLYTYVMVTSTEMMPSHHVIRIVNADYQAQKEAYLAVLTKTMKRELTRMRVREGAKAGRLHEIEDLFEQLPPQSQSHYLHCFEAFDLKSKGGLDRGELVACLQEIEPDSPVSVEDGDGKKAGQYTDREAEDWFRILGYANTGIMARQGFKCLVASLSGSADQLLEEEDALGLLLSHGGSVALQADDRVLRVDQVESVLKSVCPVVPLFQSAGSELVRDMMRNVDTSADAVLVRGPRLQGWGSPAVTPGRASEGPELAAVQTAIGSLSSREKLPTRVSMRMLASYLSRTDALRQCAGGRPPKRSLLQRFSRSPTPKADPARAASK